ncbi:hypothetical protein QR680_006514 [Steinernema hermaphroditum]|uniref:Cathepsin propeptide inhibitor domain-containing protein n=1 Tax=Steinernema hermaphroditum TaxID=289476 RepID=A0AA39LXJ5_9BILA|nr:hypothetical protein QR680_006514 [Steinernema hermaphroditum]
MFKCAVLLLLLLPLLTLSVPAPGEEAKAFEKFKKDFDRHYATPAEEAKRFEIFKKNLEEIKRLNEEKKGLTTFAVNQFSDLTEEEFGKMHSRLPGLEG